MLQDNLQGWSARELAKRMGINHNTLASWVNNGLVTPDEFGRGRRGHVIGISGLLELTVTLELHEAGFSTQTIRKVVENLRQLTGRTRPLAHLTLVVSGKDIAWKDGGEVDSSQTSALHKPGQRLMVFPVGEKHAALLSQLNSNPVLAPVQTSNDLISGRINYVS